MDAVELTIKYGNWEIAAKGPQQWVDAHVAAFLERTATNAIRPKTADSASVASGDSTEFAGVNLGAKARRWAQTHKVTAEMLQSWFHANSDGKLEVVAAAIPGVNKKEQSINAYVVEGMRTFFETDSYVFGDGPARELCQRYGCYDASNHSKTLGDLKPMITGSKDSGWEITQPGLAHGARLLAAAS
jgi:hypothetical protein